MANRFHCRMSSTVLLDTPSSLQDMTNEDIDGILAGYKEIVFAR